MAISVRPITDAELVDWLAAMGTAFHSNTPPAEVAAYRRANFQLDYMRMLGAFDGKRPVGTYESFSAELTLPGGACLAADAVSAVSVLPTHRRRGLLSRMIASDLRAARERGETASILTPSEYPIYGRFGFGPATERVEYRLDPHASRLMRTAPGRVELVEPARLRELAPPLFDRFRRTRPGQIDRWSAFWDTRLGLRPSPFGRNEGLVRGATYTSPSGELEGYLFYRVETDRSPRGGFETEVDLVELIAVSSEAYVGLWQFCWQMDLVNSIRFGMRPPDDILPWLIENPRAAAQQTRRGDFLWLRPLDVERCLATRGYAVEERLVLEVSDPLGLCGGRFLLEGGPDGATCRATQESADLSMDMSALGAITLGGHGLYPLVDAGRISVEDAGALHKAERLFHWPAAAWCSTPF